MRISCVVGLIAAATISLVACSSSVNPAAPGGMVGMPKSSGGSVLQPKTHLGPVVWDPNQLGHVTVTNNGSVPARFTLIVFDATDEGNQQNVAQFPASNDTSTVAPGATVELTVGLQEKCGAKYQRDVFLNVPVSQSTNPYSMSDVANYFYAAPGVYWYAPKCDEPPTPPRTPPPPTCEVNASTYNPCPPPPPPPNPPPGQDKCKDHSATNYNGPLPCVYPPPPPPPPTCQVPGAINIGGPLPCVFPPPPGPVCGPSFPLSGPTQTNVPNGAPARLAFVRAIGPAFSQVIAVHPPHGGTFSGNNQSGFFFTPSENFAVIIFHMAGGRGGSVDIVYTGVAGGVPLPVPSNGGDIFYFNCPS